LSDMEYVDYVLIVPLGTYGVDPDTNTVWAVLNHAGSLAATRF